MRGRRSILHVLVVAGSFLARSVFGADGDLDPTFGIGGKVVTSFDLPAAYAKAVALQPDGKIIAVGWVYQLTGALGFAVARYNPNGSLDLTFDSDGEVRTTFFGRNDTAEAVAVQLDGKILVAGTVEEDLQLRFALVRYLPDGTLDPTFDGDGRAIGSFHGFATAMVLQPDGKIVVAGSGYHGLHQDITLSRYNPNGTLDATFGTGGTAHTDVSGLWDGAVAVLFLPGGKLLAVGTTETNVTASDAAVVRYNADGSPDGTFGDSGVITFPFSSGATGAALQRDGRIVISGGFPDPTQGAGLRLLRLLPNGEIDTTFGNGGVAVAPFSSSDSGAQAVAVQSDGKIVAAGLALGSTYYDFAVARFTADGSPDAAFGSMAGVVTDFFGSGDAAYAMLIQPDGKIVAAGSARDGNGGYMALARYLASPDSPPTCPHSYGYWRAHPEEWPVTSLLLGSQSYGTAELTALLHSPTKGDASVILARQLIAAKLNLAADAGSDELAAEVAAADALLAGFSGRLPYDVLPSSALGREMARLAGRLASTTNRSARPGCGEVKLPK